jgi:propanol-preferring alcohol dehydrogenase
MKAMILKGIASLIENKTPLVMADVPRPQPGEREILIKVRACGVCHTEMDEIEGRTAPPHFPVILGHQVVGTVEEFGPGAGRFRKGQRVGVAWIFSSCGRCKFCERGLENLCPDFRATGRDADGGYAEYMRVREDYAYPIPEVFSDDEAAPLLCAGTIGWRSFKLTGLENGQSLGLTGFGASASLVISLVRHTLPDSKIHVFSRNKGERDFARELGAVWTGEITDRSPEKLDGIIDTTPAWKPIVEALHSLESGGRLVINAIRKLDDDKDELMRLDYGEDLWMERVIKSVANVTRKDVTDCLKIAAEIPLKPEIQTYSLEEANKALVEMKESKIRGAKVLKISS